MNRNRIWRPLGLEGVEGWFGRVWNRRLIRLLNRLVLSIDDLWIQFWSHDGNFDRCCGSWCQSDELKRRSDLLLLCATNWFCWFWVNTKKRMMVQWSMRSVNGRFRRDRCQGSMNWMSIGHSQKRRLLVDRNFLVESTFDCWFALVTKGERWFWF